MLKIYKEKGQWRATLNDNLIEEDSSFDEIMGKVYWNHGKTIKKTVR